MHAAYRSCLAPRDGISTQALIQRCLTTADISQLKSLEADLEAAIGAGLLPQLGRSVLKRVRERLVRADAEALFVKPGGADRSPH